MRVLRAVLCVVMFGGAVALVSCKKESTPADKIDAATQKVEGAAVDLKKEGDAKKVEAENAEAPTVDLPKPTK